MKAAILIPLLATMSMMFPPNAGMVLFGQTPGGVVKPGDAIRIEIPVSQIDQPITKLFLAIPFNPVHLKYIGFTDSKFSAGTTTAANVSGGPTLGSINIQWTGAAPAGSEGILGVVEFQVLQAASNQQIVFTGANPAAYDASGVMIPEITYPDGSKAPAVVVEKTGIIQVLRRSIKIILHELIG